MKNGYVLVCAIGSLLSCASESYSQSGSIGASPNPCQISVGQSVCTSLISWTSQDTTQVQVWISENGAPETNFATSNSGPASQDAPWIQGPPNTYNFRLYDYSSGSRGALLGSVTVTGNPPPTTGTISAVPSPCILYFNQTTCSTTITWNASGVTQVQVWVSDNGAPPTNFATSGSGQHSQIAPWIQYRPAPGGYTFYLYNCSSGTCDTNNPLDFVGVFAQYCF
jgi:hypothetical protein